MLAMLGMAVFASFTSFWPYDLSPSLRHYTQFVCDGNGQSNWQYSRTMLVHGRSVFVLFNGSCT